MIADELFPFEWLAPPNGYHWVIGTYKNGAEDRWLEEHPSDGGPMRLREPYEPMQKYPTLFRSFAELPQTEEGILGFANAYGWLGLYEERWAEAIPKDGYPEMILSPLWGYGSKWFYAESLSSWLDEIRAMHLALELWDAINNIDLRWFMENIEIAADRRKPNGTSILQYNVRGESMSASIYDDAVVLPETINASEDILQTIPSSHVIHSGWKLLVEILNRQLAKYTASSFDYVARDGRYRLHVIPKHLLGALWLQLSRGVDGNKTYLRCRGCETWLEVSLKATGYRTSRAYCSDACRSKAYRDRQRLARQLHEEGASLEVIAEQLDTEPDTVQKWIDLGQQKRRRPSRRSKTANK